MLTYGINPGSSTSSRSKFNIIYKKARKTVYISHLSMVPMYTVDIIEIHLYRAWHTRWFITCLSLFSDVVLTLQMVQSIYLINGGPLDICGGWMIWPKHKQDPF